jgi:competence protein ComEA
MPPAECRALLVLLALCVAGQAVRHLATKPGAPAGQVQLLGTLSPGSPLAHKDSAIRQARPLEPGERINVDEASLPELTRLPRVGPRLAKVILADRTEKGSFGSLAGLDRVAGVGPGLLKLIEPHVVFSQAAGPRSGKVVSNTAQDECLSGVSASQPGCPVLPLNLNTASITQLDSLPGIGPAKAAAILQYRQEHGPFNSIEDLAKVPGFGPGAMARLQPRLTVR